MLSSRLWKLKWPNTIRKTNNKTEITVYHFVDKQEQWRKINNHRQGLNYKHYLRDIIFNSRF